MVMSTRCSASLTATSTRGFVLLAVGPARMANIYGVGNFWPVHPSATPATKAAASSLYVLIRLASNHDLLRLLVEGNLLAGLDCGDVHA